MTGELPNKVALLRGVNVGGRKVVMADLRAAATRLGWSHVSTYIASGNLLFQATGAARPLAAELVTAIAADIGLAVDVLVLTGPQMAQFLADCPLAEAPGNLVHGVFCWQAPVIDDDALGSMRAADEVLVTRGPVVWLHAPSGVGRSALMAKIGKVIRGTPITARNLNTVRALAARLSPNA